MKEAQSIDKVALVEQYIIWLRGEKVMLDLHLAKLYGVETRALVQAIKRNIERFPDDLFLLVIVSTSKLLKSFNLKSLNQNNIVK